MLASSSSVSEAQSIQNRFAVLETLVWHAMRPAPAGDALRDLYNPEADVSTAAAYFLLDLYPSGGVDFFTSQTLRRLMQQLNRSTEQQQEELRSQVRGRIIWTATYKARYSQGYDPTRFVCREVHHRYDTYENQLLKYMMVKIGECLKIVPEVIRRGICFLPEAGGRLSIDTATRLGRMEVALSNSWRNIKLREINVPNHITEQHLLHADTSRLEEYSQVARLYRHYQRVVLKPSWQALAGAGKRVLPLPGVASSAGECWIRLGAAILQAPLREDER